MKRAREAFAQSPQRGYNLVEVLVAMAILGSVLLSIMTLFIFGRRNVYSGKQMTLANSVGTRVTEDLVPLSRNAMYTAFGITDSTTLSDPNIAGVDYEDVYVVSTDNVATDPQGYLTRWRALMAARNFANGRVSLIFKPTMYESGKTFSGADILRVRILVQWNEGARPRSIVLDTVKVDN